MKLKILLVQNSAIIGNKKATFNNVETLLEQYEEEKPDLIIFPEVWSIGWYCKNFQAEAEEIENSETISFLKNVALNFNSTVIGGSFICKHPNNVYKNTCPVIDKAGKLVTTYDKMHLFSHIGSEENKFVTTGDELKILNLNGTKIGLSICYDIRFPELYREYSKHGVEVLVNMAAWSNKKPKHWAVMHKARAIENQCFMITVDQTGKIVDDEYNLGHSMIIDPWGETEEMLHEEEACLLYEIDTYKAKNLRQNFPLLKDRRDENTKYFNVREIKLYE